MGSKRESFRSIKGTFDVLPEESSSDGNTIAGSPSWRHVESVVREVMDRYGVREIRTPIIEPTPLIARGVGQTTDIVSKEMFAFERGDTQYVLRPEVTAPVMRAYLQHNLGQQRAVQKLFYIGPCFRAERPQRGRYRQFHQFGAEYIGSANVRADAEVIALMTDVYAGLGIGDCTVRLNTLGDVDARPSFVSALQDYLAPHVSALSETSRRRLEQNPLRILDTKNPVERELLVDAPRLSSFISDDSRDRYDRLKEMLDALGVTFVEDPFLVRGLDYYTETAFELETAALEGAQTALAGGGRYDLLAEELGARQPVPATGFAAGIERLLLAMKAHDARTVTDARPDLFVVLAGDDAATWGVEFVHQLRRAGARCELDLSGRSVKAQMREANRTRSRFVIVVGSTETASGEGRVRSMETGEEQNVRLTVESVRKLLATS